jgi:hypothetical protein
MRLPQGCPSLDSPRRPPPLTNQDIPPSGTMMLQSHVGEPQTQALSPPEHLRRGDHHRALCPSPFVLAFDLKDAASVTTRSSPAGTGKDVIRNCLLSGFTFLRLQRSLFPRPVKLARPPTRCNTLKSRHHRSVLHRLPRHLGPPRWCRLRRYDSRHLLSLARRITLGWFHRLNIQFVVCFPLDSLFCFLD